MGKIKIILAVVVVYFIYKGFTAMKDFNLAVTKKDQKVKIFCQILKVHDLSFQTLT